MAECDNCINVYVCMYCSDIDKIQSGIGDKMAIFLQYFTTFVTAFIIAYFVNWKLALVVSVTLPVVIAMGVLLTKVGLIGLHVQ